jgi:hypothetical protein
MKIIKITMLRRYSFDNVKRNEEFIEYDKYSSNIEIDKENLFNFVKEEDFQSYRKPDWVLNFNWKPITSEIKLKNQEVWISDQKICHYNNSYKEDRKFTIFIMGDNYLDFVVPDYIGDDFDHNPDYHVNEDGTFNENTFLGKLHKFWQNKLNKLIGKEYDDDDCPYFICIDTKEHFSRFDIDTKVKDEDCNCAIMCPCDACDGDKFKFIKF